MSDRHTDREKQRIREAMWRLLESEGAARFPGARGRIPNFRGAEAAADELAATQEWRAGRVVKANPDSPQLAVRRRARLDGKTLYMAVPRLTTEKPFVLVESDPTIKRALADGAAVRVHEMQPVDLVVCGTVAVNRDGVRIGKGGGYSDLEFGLLSEAGLVGPATTIVTTVHPLQLVDEELPETAHDFRVDVVVTAEEVLSTGADRARRPAGILWDHLDEEKIAAVPVLAGLARGR